MRNPATTGITLPATRAASGPPSSGITGGSHGSRKTTQQRTESMWNFQEEGVTASLGPATAATEARPGAFPAAAAAGEAATAAATTPRSEAHMGAAEVSRKGNFIPTS
jgi:hypothetical protein